MNKKLAILIVGAFMAIASPSMTFAHCGSCGSSCDGEKKECPDSKDKDCSKKECDKDKKE